jgi:two-component system sensor kinase FixL
MGPGVFTEDKDHLFTPFFTTKTHGMGLGLTICRTIIEAHGGKISFVPDVKIGTVTRFTLPVSDEGVLDYN